MAIENVPLDLIDENPFNQRKHYAQGKVFEMSSSLREIGLRQVPEGRRINGKVQLAYGHMRFQGFLQNQKKAPEKWKAMPIDIKEISDQEMFDFSIEENLRRTDITSIELARSVQAFSEMFPDVLDEEIGKKHSMSAQNVSNMKRVLRLPQKFLDKIDAGVISFTQGRELLTLEGLPEAENLMTRALDDIMTGNKRFGHPNTVEGLQKAIHDVIQRSFPPLEKEFAWGRYDLVFDTQAAGCLECEKMIRTHPTKSGTAHFCADEKCWIGKQEEHKKKAAADATAKMEAEVVARAAQAIAEADAAAAPPEPAPVMIDEHTILVDQETLSKIEASNSCGQISEDKPVKKPVSFEDKLYLTIGSGGGEARAYQLVPRAEYAGELRTYKTPAGREHEEYLESLRNDPNGFYHGMVVKSGGAEYVLVGPEVTFVTKVDKGDFSQEKSAAPDYTVEQRGTSWVSLDGEGLVIAIGATELHTNKLAEAYFEPVPTKLNPVPGEYKLNHTYRISPKNRAKTVPDVTAQNLATAIKALELTPDTIESVRVWKSSGKPGTSGAISAGWSKCTESMEEEDETAKLYKERDLGAPGSETERQLEAAADERDRVMEEAREKANLERPAGVIPCETCLKGKTCDRSFFHVADDDSGRLVCEQWDTAETSEKLTKVLTHDIPAENLRKAKEAAGTRAEVLDLVDITTSNDYRRQIKPSYVDLSYEINHIDDPEECTERCTHGFHYAFDSKAKEPKEIHICSDPKCMAKKKGAFTRMRNAEGHARKNAEKEAIKQVTDQVGQVTTLLAEHVQGITAVAGVKTPVMAVTKTALLLILHSQLHGQQISKYYYSGDAKAPENWLWDRLSSGTRKEERKEQALWKLILKLSDAELVKLIVGMMFYYLQDHGDVASYEIKTAAPLALFGIDINDAVNDLVKKEVAVATEDAEGEKG